MSSAPRSMGVRQNIEMPDDCFSVTNRVSKIRHNNPIPLTEPIEILMDYDLLA
jgi:hypothetical protein